MAAESLTAYDFELYAKEALYTLTENLFLGDTIHRDFEDKFALPGQTVQARRPATYDALPKANGDAVTKQTPSASEIILPLDQHLHVSIPFNDMRVATSKEAVITDFIQPAAEGLARQIERRILGCATRVPVTQGVGRAGTISASNVYATITDATTKLDGLLAPSERRNMAFGTRMKNALLNTDAFMSTERVGSTMPIRDGMIDRRIGFNLGMTQNVGDVDLASCEVTLGAINLAAGYAAGHSGAMTVDTFSGSAGDVGCWATIAGDDTPLILSAVGASATTSITAANTPLKRAVANDAVVTVYQSADAAASYAVGYNKGIDVDGIASGKRLQVGQIFSHIVSSVRYNYLITKVTNVASTSCTVYLDRPLEAALANNDLVFPGPAMATGMAYHRNGITMAVRPLPLVPGQQMYTMNYKGYSVRLSLTYDGSAQEQLLTLDLLMGVVPLDTNLIVPVWS